MGVIVCRVPKLPRARRRNRRGLLVKPRDPFFTRISEQLADKGFSSPPPTT